MAFKTDEPNIDIFAKASKEVRRAVTPIVDEIADAVEELKAAEKAADEAKEKLRGLAKARYWALNFQSEQPVHTFDANGRSSTAQINFPNKYSVSEDQYKRLSALLGDAEILDLIGKKNLVTLDLSDLEGLDLQNCLKDLIAVRDTYDVPAVGDDKYVVADGFHDSRHLLMPAINEAIDKVMPLQVHITV